MKINQDHLYSPKRSLGFKRLLLRLNRDLDHVKRDISFNSDFGRHFSHSIFVSDSNLTNIEVAALYLEDRRFFSHNGFEVRSFLRALKRLLTRGTLNGMSTIDQQVVRISLKRYERTFSRKLNEIAIAIFLNHHVSKRSIFDYYIHNAYLGYKIQGCEVAARKIFGTRAADLDQRQAAFVVSLFPLPFPRLVWEKYVNHPQYPFHDPDDIIEIATEITPRWAKRLKYRMSVAQDAYDRMPRSL